MNLKKYNGREVRVAGIVTDVSHRISKKGTGWGIFTIQDFNSSLEIPLFSEDYQKFKALLEVSQCVFIKGSMQKRWNSEEYQLKIKEVNLLETVGNNMAESITIKLPLETITQQLVNDLDDLCLKYKGQHKLRVQFIDRRHRHTLTLAARARKVEVGNDFIQGLERIGITYKLN